MTRQSNRARMARASTAGAGIMSIGAYVTQSHLSTGWTIVALASIWACAVVALWNVLDVTGDKRHARRVVKGALSVILATSAVVIFGREVWPRGIPEKLNDAQRLKLVASLKASARREPITLMCPPSSERDCIVAGQFVSIFEEAGWQVNDEVVQRVFAGIPQSGLYFVLHVNGKHDFSRPEQGLWTGASPAYISVIDAFSQIVEMDPDPFKRWFSTDRLVTGESFPAGQIGIYFGDGTARP